MEEKKLEILNKQIGRTINKLNAFLNDLLRYISNYHKFNSITWYSLVVDEMNEGVRLIKDYNSLGNKELMEVKEIKISEEIGEEKIDIAAAEINKIIRELQTARDYLYAYLRPNINEIEKGKIELLRNEIEELITDDKIIRNLEIALNEAETGHELACSLISARVIVERLEKIEGKNDEERLAKLVEGKIIDNTESSKFSSKAFLEASRAARNAISHKNSWFPTGAESLSLLSSAFRMTSWVSQYLNKKGVEVNGQNL